MDMDWLRYEIAEAGSSLTGIVGSLAVIFLISCIYFIPSIIASKRKAKSFGIIFVLNLLGGATGFFWFVAFLWACFGATRQPPTLGQWVNPSSLAGRAGNGTNE
jgi:hypothetical protein